MADESGERAAVVVAAAGPAGVLPEPGDAAVESHPRVFLDIADDRRGMCPYCGTRYRLDGGPRKAGTLNLRRATSTPDVGRAAARRATLASASSIVAPSWVGDAILSEPLIALPARPRRRRRSSTSLAPPWCAPVYARMRGIGRIIEARSRTASSTCASAARSARTLRGARATRTPIVLPNSWKSALVPWLARIPRRIGYAAKRATDC